MMLKALVFDVDGTLAETEDAHRAAWNATFAEHALPWYWTHARYARLLAVSGGRARLRLFIRGLRLGARERARLERLVPALHADKSALYRAYVDQGRVTLRPGVARLLDEARAAGITLALAASTSAVNVEALLVRNLGADARTWFHLFAAETPVAQRKPAPDIFTYAVRALGLKPGDCVAFEDSGNGVAAATAAGLYTVATPSAWSTGQDVGGAQLVIEHLGDPAHPLAASAAARVGAPYLGVMALARLQRGWLAQGSGLH